jgi:hypothetical protein
MIQDRATSLENQNRFFLRIKEKQSAWFLSTPQEGMAYCPSNEFEDVDVFLFWSDQAYAKRQAKEEWENYIPREINLDQLNNVLRSIHNDNDLIGLNWDANLCGIELEPIEAAKKIFEPEP